MTQTLIEQLEALPRYAPNIGGDMIYSGQPPETLKWITADDLRAIIEKHKAEKQEPIAWLCVWKPTGASFPTKLKDDMEHFRANGYEIIPLYRTTQPDIVSELVKALEDDAYAATFQSMAGYRTALIAKAKGMMG